MLLIANFDQSLTNEQTEPPLLSLAQHIAEELGESYEQTYLTSVAILETSTNLENTPALAPIPPTNLYTALVAGSRPNCSWLSLGWTTTGPTNYNRLAEKLLYYAGLFQPHHHHKEYENSNVESEWYWNEEGPIVIIPPHDNPALTLFLGHALVHYSEEVEKWAGLYVVTGYQPLQIQEWD